MFIELGDTLILIDDILRVTESHDCYSFITIDLRSGIPITVSNTTLEDFKTALKEARL